MRGDGPGTVLVVGLVLWFCATLATSAVIGHAVWLADAEDPGADLASVDWRPLWTTALAWVATLNVPVWGLVLLRWRMKSG